MAYRVRVTEVPRFSGRVAVEPERTFYLTGFVNKQKFRQPRFTDEVAQAQRWKTRDAAERNAERMNAWGYTAHVEEG